MLEAYLEVLDKAYFEVTEAFKGLANENVWKRPVKSLLSVGELAGHMAYWEAVKFAGEWAEPEPDLAKCKISSSLVDSRFLYYPISVDAVPSTQHLEMTADQVCSELLRVHGEAVSHLKNLNPDLEETPPGRPVGWTYGEYLRYAPIHIAYHTGQIYSVRHLLGDQTPDN
jgi:hypothetical protein